MQPALDGLWYFAKVVEHGGFAAAGRALGIPKSRLSRQVDALESRLGLRLLQRSTRRFRVTETGQTVYRHATAMLAEAEAALDAAAAATAEPRGLLRVACPVSIAQSMLAPVLPGFLAAHPQLCIDLEVSNRRVDLLAEGFDAALRVRTRPSGEDGVVMRQFAELDELLVASPGYLARAPRLDHPAKLAQHPTLSFTPGARQAWTLIGPGGEAFEVEHAPRLSGHSFEVMRAAALAGAGIALLPEGVVREDLAQGRLLRVLPDWRMPQGIFHVVYPHRRGLLPGVRAFIDFLVETMPMAARAGGHPAPTA
jgi:DNA-binding transcriptional LysR family regulator